MELPGELQHADMVDRTAVSLAGWDYAFGYGQRIDEAIETRRNAAWWQGRRGMRHLSGYDATGKKQTGHGSYRYLKKLAPVRFPHPL